VERTIRLLLAYDGTRFRGWAAQRDPAIRTIEGALTEVLSDVVGHRVKLSVAGRTDAGVHARGQVSSFVTTSSREPVSMRDAINGSLGPEVVALDVRGAPDGFDARFSASARAYRYRIGLGPAPSPFDAAFVWHHPFDPRLRAMRRGAQHLIGERDFASFCRHPGPGKTTTRDLQRVSISRSGDRLEIGFRANAFLHQMVRAHGDPGGRGGGPDRSRPDPGDPGRARPFDGPAHGPGARPDARAGDLRSTNLAALTARRFRR
jgi:tRNA pseudouridine38-40 synthase